MTRTFLGGSGIKRGSIGFLLVLKEEFVLFHRSAHAGNEIALEEKEHQHDWYDGNQNGGGKLVVLRRELGAELNKSKRQCPQLVGAQKVLIQDKLLPITPSISAAQ